MADPVQRCASAQLRSISVTQQDLIKNEEELTRKECVRCCYLHDGYWLCVPEGADFIGLRCQPRVDEVAVVFLTLGA